MIANLLSDSHALAAWKMPLLVGRVKAMDAQVWTLIGLLAAISIGSFFRTETRFDTFMDRFESRFDAQTARMDTVTERINRVEQTQMAHDKRFNDHDRRFDAIDMRFDGIDKRLETHDRRFDDLETLIRAQGEQLATAIYALGTKLDDHIQRHAS